MAETVGLAVRVIAIIELSAKVSALCLDYSTVNATGMVLAGCVASPCEQALADMPVTSVSDALLVFLEGGIVVRHLGRNIAQHGIRDRALIWCNKFVDITVGERWVEGKEPARGGLPRYSSTPGCSMINKKPATGDDALHSVARSTSSSRGWRRRPLQGSLRAEPLATTSVVTLRDERRSPLSRAVENENRNAVELLLKYGARPGFYGDNPYTPLGLA
ncbi:hypothetical protein B0T10DRAFT_580067 [Thelonectria olida]|uniref:Ankyrin repeat protein n=1 Tax=Thelonectria olida TaxID=1576542 RepID=A0A9P8VWT7_9HYPO|nr:hypothetical protein B0T10DRAFT_580067 [Thelonectria olida]